VAKASPSSAERFMISTSRTSAPTTRRPKAALNGPMGRSRIVWLKSYASPASRRSPTAAPSWMALGAITTRVSAGRPSLTTTCKVETVFDYPDGRFKIRHEGRELPYSVFGRLSQIRKADIVNNKRLGAMLSMAREAQLENNERRSKSCPSRPFPGASSMQ
jgi:hypothetical protein